MRKPFNMRKPFHEILHPPEVKGAQQHRYWIAVMGWLVFALFGFLFFVGLEALLMFLYERRFGATALGAQGEWILGGVLISGVLGVFLGDFLWGLAFIKTGYLSRATVIRIRTNRAPTARGEHIHRRISLSLSLLIPVALIWVGWYLKSWWMMSLMFLLGVWLFWSIWAGWKNADAMNAGNAPLPSEFEGVTDDLDKPKGST